MTQRSAGSHLKVLDLFCGLKGWSQPFADRGHKVVTVDMDDGFKPTIVSDVRLLSANKLIDTYGSFDIILASPPCECFSVASIGHHWRQGGNAPFPKTHAAAAATVLLFATIELIEQLNPRFFIIENPRGMMRKMPSIKPLHRETVTYCQYGETRMKPTDLWGRFPEALQLKPMCKNGDPCHEAAPRGSRTGTQGIKTYADRSFIPYKLALDVCLATEQSDHPAPMSRQEVLNLA